MSQLLKLPSGNKKEDKDELSQALDQLLQPALEERNRRQIMWWITDAYLQGARQFSVVDWRRGLLAVSWEEEDGSLGLRHEEALTKIETEVGRLSRLDLAPRAKKRENTLESLRNASLAQVLLDQHESNLGNAREIAIGFLRGLVNYGTYGVTALEDATSESAVTHVRELVPPWELLSFPANRANPTDQRALGRTRLFPLSEILSQSSRFQLPDNEDSLEIIELPYGSNLRNVAGPGLRSGFTVATEALDETASGASTALGAARRKELGKPQGKMEKFVRLREFWIMTPKGTVARSIVRAGRAIIMDRDFLRDNMQVPAPIGITRYHDTGQFYGRSFAEKIIPLALEIEEMMQRAIVDSANINRLWFLLVPDSLGLTPEDFLADDYPKVAFYSPDLSRPDLKIENVVPPNFSDLAQKTLAFVTTMQDRIVAQGPLFEGEAPGRAESGKFINILAQTGATHLVPVAEGVESAYAAMFRHLLWLTRDRLIRGPFPDKGLALTRIDNSIAGVTIDSETGRMILDPSGLPDPMEVELGIQAADPTETERRRTEGLQALQFGILTPLEFIILNYKENWNYPIGQRAVWENYVKAVLYNLILFNNGDEPGQLPGSQPDPQNPGQVTMTFFNQFFDKPEVHLKAIEDFVAGTEFSLGSPVIQQVFAQRIEQLKLAMGQQLPAGFPSVDEAAAQAAAGNPGGQQNFEGLSAEDLQRLAGSAAGTGA